MKKIIPLILMFTLLSNNNNTIGYCDIKGNIKNPGVYPVYKNSTIQDIIKTSGGLKKNSYTDMINLSKKVKDEMVIYIFSKSELEEIKRTCTCEEKIKYIECNPNQNESNDNLPEKVTTITTIESTVPQTTTQTATNTITTIITTSSAITNPSNNLININTCTIDELLNIKGLGEAKAKSIIDYRETNGLFSSIEDLLNVKGIGNSTFEKIKEFITT